MRPSPLRALPRAAVATRDRKSTRLNSSHSQISYAVFCLKKKKGLRTGGLANSLNRRFTSLVPLKVQLFSVPFRRVLGANHHNASQIWRHDTLKYVGSQS